MRLWLFRHALYNNGRQKICEKRYCSYESGKKEMPKDIAEKLSALLNMPVKEIMSVDYAKEELSKEATDLLDKVFKLIGDLDYRGIRELNHSFNDIHKENGFIKYLHIFRLHLIDMGKKKVQNSLANSMIEMQIYYLRIILIIEVILIKNHLH